MHILDPEEMGETKNETTLNKIGKSLNKMLRCWEKENWFHSEKARSLIQLKDTQSDPTSIL